MRLVKFFLNYDWRPISGNLLSMTIASLYARIRGAWPTKLLFITLLALLLWGVLRSTPPQQYFEESDKVLHLLAFTSVAFVGRLALLHMRGVFYWPLILLGATSLELVQGWLWTSRHFSLLDAAANVLGVLLAAVAYLVVKHLVGLESGKRHPKYRS